MPVQTLRDHDDLVELTKSSYKVQKPRFLYRPEPGENYQEEDYSSRSLAENSGSPTVHRSQASRGSSFNGQNSNNYTPIGMVTRPPSEIHAQKPMFNKEFQIGPQRKITKISIRRNSVDVTEESMTP